MSHNRPLVFLTVLLLVWVGHTPTLLKASKISTLPKGGDARPQHADGSKNNAANNTPPDASLPASRPTIPAAGPVSDQIQKPTSTPAVTPSLKGGLTTKIEPVAAKMAVDGRARQQNRLGNDIASEGRDQAGSSGEAQSSGEEEHDNEKGWTVVSEEEIRSLMARLQQQAELMKSGTSSEGASQGQTSPIDNTVKETTKLIRSKRLLALPGEVTEGPETKSRSQKADTTLKTGDRKLEK
ncbi:unnamed protein product [Protopolystoma xenopodis]|uniref:Secreted protein n=1 Tax=Protopolystoma xenopodis TaxID=117903 RepID=A0A3S5AA27_9PLAT|nr:unnamed protein product [Protopolystoma xenopodis]